MNYLTYAFPLYINIILGVLSILIFTGSWVLLNDLNTLANDALLINQRSQINSALMKIRVRRILALLTGVGLIIMYFWGRNLVGFTALIFGLFIWDSMTLIGRMRRFVNSIVNK